MPPGIIASRRTGVSGCETKPGLVFGFAVGATGQLIPALSAMGTDLLLDRFLG